LVLCPASSVPSAPVADLGSSRALDELPSLPCLALLLARVGPHPFLAYGPSVLSGHSAPVGLLALSFLTLDRHRCSACHVAYQLSAPRLLSFASMFGLSVSERMSHSPCPPVSAALHLSHSPSLVLLSLPSNFQCTSACHAVLVNRNPSRQLSARPGSRVTSRSPRCRSHPAVVRFSKAIH